MTVCDEWLHWKFGLLVTGHGEQKGIERLFRSVAGTGLCSFTVIRKIDQCTPRTSTKKHPNIVGTNKPVVPRDIENIGFPVRKFLTGDKNRFIILIDDLEHSRCEIRDEVEERYEKAMHTVLPVEFQHRCSVHFFVMMLEAYFFANTDVLNSVVGSDYSDCKDDVEEIPHPKNKILKDFPHYRETEHAVEILRDIDVEHILANPKQCSNLRKLFSWCMRHLKTHPRYADAIIPKFLDDLT